MFPLKVSHVPSLISKINKSIARRHGVSIIIRKLCAFPGRLDSPSAIFLLSVLKTATDMPIIAITLRALRPIVLLHHSHSILLK